jgi:hypothetical protein
VKVWQSGERVAELSCREHDRDPLCQQAAGNEREHPLGLAIEPLRVIDRTEQRPLLGRLRQQPKHRQPDQERVRGRVGGTPSQSEGDGTGLALGLRKAFHEVEHRRAQLLKRRVWELHFRIDPCGLERPEVSRVLELVLDDGALADARLAVDDQDPATAAACGVKQPVDRFELPFPAEEPAAWRPND